jgi:glycosyltransferase involved in cell wall biosynthesis
MATGGFRFSTRLPKTKRIVLAILTTHPIQYQVPLWQALARDGRVPFEVWYLSKHAAEVSRDRDFGKSFAWDLDMLAGYPHQFLDVNPGAAPNDFWKCRLRESLASRMRNAGVKALWIQGWQVAAYWQAVWAAKKSGAEVWLRGESNDLAPTTIWKRAIKCVVLGQLFRRVDRFLYIGTANRRLYEKFGVLRERLHPAPYAVDNERFRQQANEIRKSKLEIRKQWKIPENAFCVLFCGKFIPKKRPMDLIAAAQLARRSLGEGGSLKIHLLFAGSGELGEQLRANCNIVFDAENPNSSPACPPEPWQRRVTRHSSLPIASFTGFLNQTEISRAYVAADCLVLPSDYRETWGLVVNEAMTSGLHCVISDQCGCAEDLGAKEGNAVFRCGDVGELADKLRIASGSDPEIASAELPSFSTTLETVAALYV